MREPTPLRDAIRAWAAGGPEAPEAAGAARRLARAGGLRTVMLVEGVSDRAAVEALAARQGRDLAGEGVCVVPMGGAMGVRRFLRVCGDGGLGARLRGLCDEAEEGHYRRGLVETGHADPAVAAGGSSRAAMEALGFHVCVADLEDELIRALGVEVVERVLAAEGDLDRFRSFQRQPAQRGRAADRQLRRFLGTLSGRKERYARVLVLALDSGRVPRPLGRLLAT